MCEELEYAKSIAKTKEEIRANLKDREAHIQYIRRLRKHVTDSELAARYHPSTLCMLQVEQLSQLSH